MAIKSNTSISRNLSFFSSFTDICLLLLVFFIFLLSFSSFHVNYLTEISDGVKSALGSFSPTQTPPIDTPTPTHYPQTDLDAGLFISLNQDVLFNSGKTSLKNSAFPYLDKLMSTLKGKNVLVVVEGHTDSIPIHTNAITSNWHLSSIRAAEICYYLHQNGYPSHLLKAVGFGPSKPIASNATAEGRKKNRRVEIYVKKIPKEAL